jgi:AraC-like DNA-binding protein
MLTAVLAGRGRYLGPDGVTAVGPGMLGLVPPQRPGVLASDPDDPYDHWYCRFSGGHASELAARILAARGGRRFAACSQVRRIAGDLRAAGERHRRDLPTRMGRPELILAGILVALDRPDQAEDPAMLSADGLRDHLRRHLDMPTDLAATARRFGVSLRTLTRRCRMLTGSSVQRLHEDMKLDWAADLLATTAAPIGEVARRVGYTDPAYFSRVFRRRRGLAPLAWRSTQAGASGSPGG